MKFRLIGNELVGQPDYSNPEQWKAMANGKDDMPKYTVLPSDLEHFRSKEEWKEGEFVVQYETNDFMLGWITCDKESYDDREQDDQDYRIVARPLQTTKAANKTDNPMTQDNNPEERVKEAAEEKYPKDLIYAHLGHIPHDLNKHNRDAFIAGANWQSQDAGEKEGWIAEIKKLRLLLKREVEQTGGNWNTYESIHHLNRQKQ